MQKGQALIFLLIGILIIALVGGAYYLGTKKSFAPIPSPAPVVTTQTPQPTLTPSNSDETVYTESDRSANWKTYTDDVNKFSLRYPKEWREEVRDKTDSSSKAVLLTPAPIELQGGQIPGIFIIVIENKNHLTSKEYFNQAILPSQKDSVCKDIKIVPNVPESLKNFDVTVVEGLCGIFNQGPRIFISKGNNIISLSSGFEEVNNQLINKIFSTFKFIEQPSGISEQNKKDEVDIRRLISNFYIAFGAQDGKLLFSYMTPPVSSREKGEYSWLTGADLGQNAFYRAFSRVKLSNPSIKSINRLNDKTAEVNATDELQSYSQSSTEWGKPTVRNVVFTVVKIQTETQEGWVIDKFTYIGTINWTYKGTEKYDGFPNLDSN